MQLEFEKWHGCRNDFMIIHASPQRAELILPSLRKIAAKYCSRDGSGVGADGILLIARPENYEDLSDLNLFIINADGSLADNCGNGLRVAALSVRKAQMDYPRPVPVPGELEFRVGERTFAINFHNQQEKQRFPLVSIAMGKATVGQENPWHSLAVEKTKGLGSAPVTSVNLGNNHLALMYSSLPDHTEFCRLGKDLQSSDGWDGINVHLAAEKEISTEDQRIASQSLGAQIEELYEVLCYERGVGPTQACGSGACAVAMGAFESGMVSEGGWIGIDMPGGRLYVSQKLGSPILAGPGEFLFTGKIEL